MATQKIGVFVSVFVAVKLDFLDFSRVLASITAGSAHGPVKIEGRELRAQARKDAGIVPGFLRKRKA